MVRLRLTRRGTRKRPFYRIVAADSRKARDGRIIEQIGFFNPMIEPNELKLDLERVDYWIGTGAQPSDIVSNLIKRARKADA
jgi:small subunit ribosomal protein S16